MKHIFVIIFILLSLVGLAYIFHEQIFAWYTTSPPELRFVVEQIVSGSPLGLIILFALLSISFVPIPMEMSLVSSLALSSDRIITFLSIYAGIVIGQCINYLLGMIFGSIIKKKDATPSFFEKNAHAWGPVILFFTHIPPLPFTIFNMLSGAFKMPFKKWFLSMLLGVAMYTLIIMLAGDFIIHLVSSWIHL